MRKGRSKPLAPECDALEAAAAELRPDLPNGHDRSIARTLALSIDLVGDSGRDVLLLASTLAPDVIPIELVDAVLEQLGTNSSWGAAAVVDPVVNQSLAEDATQSNGQPGYRVHTLLQRTMRFRHELVDRRELIRTLAVQALLKVLPVVADIRAHASVSGYLPHARQLALSLSTTEEAELGLWIAKFDQERGAFGLARAQGEAVLEAMRRLLGDEHPQTLTARNNLAATLKAQGELSAACEHQESVLEASRRLLGDEHPDTLRARLNLAATLDALGDLAAARDHEEAVLEAMRRLLGDAHPNTLTARANLAQTLKAQGDLAGARGHEEAVLTARRVSLGNEHPETLTVRNNLAGTLK